MNRLRYSEYKPSGVEWLGEVPRYWEVRRLKYCATCNDDVLPESTPLDYRIRYVDISSVSLEQGIEKIEEYDFDDAPSRARRRVRDGDTILSTVRTYLKAVARIEKPDETLIVSTGFAVIRPGEALDSRFLSYLLRSDGFVGEVVANSVGVSYPAINASQVMGFVSLIPPIEEQRAIAAFLDRETARIDALIEKKRRFIELLQENRAALISRAVTRGLDPNVPLKDSGIEWLGQIPAHWEKHKFHYLFAMMGGITPDKGNIEYWEGDVPWMTPKDMKVEKIGDSEDKLTQLALRETNIRLIEPGVVLIVVRGMILVHTFPVAETTCRATINQDMKALIPVASLSSEYLAWFLRGISLYILSLVEESAHGTKALRTDQFQSIEIYLPSLDEQKAIVSHLSAETAKLDALRAKIESAIEKIKECRAALTAAAVTGKIDVRGAVCLDSASTPTDIGTRLPA